MRLTKIILRIAKNFKFLPKKTFLKIRFQYHTGKVLHLDPPVEFNEKIQWMKLYYHPPILTQLADKYAVRAYVSEKIGHQYLNMLYGVYDSVEEVDFDTLPDKFVLKGVHGSSTNLIVHDKTTLNYAKTKKLLRKWLKHNQYKKVGYEWAYKNIKPRIISEAFLETDNGNLIDYKYHCFNGQAKFIFAADSDTKKTSRGFNFYDLQWNELPLTKHLKNSEKKPFKTPENLDKMTKFAEILAGTFPYVRVDFYNVEGRIIFGEMTFYPSDGKKDYYPDKYNKIIGDYIQLPKLKKGQKEIISY